MKQNNPEGGLVSLSQANNVPQLVSEFSNKENRIRVFSLKDKRWIKCYETINKCGFNIGIRSAITSEEFTYVQEFLSKYFKDFTIEEIEIAFEQYAAGNLSFKDKPFNSMDNKFIGDVLTSYRTLRNKKVSEFNALESQKKEVEPTEEEKQKIMDNYFQECFVKPYEMLLKTGALPMDEIVRADFCKRFYLALAFDITPEIKEKYNKLAEEQIKRDAIILDPMSVSGLQQMIEKIKSKPVVYYTNEEKVHISSVKRISSALFFKDWLTEQAKEKTPVEELLNMIK